jgi:hypothetical protein
LNLGHALAAQDHCAALIHQTVLLFGVVVCQVVLQPLEELALASFVAIETEAHQRGVRLLILASTAWA